MPTWEKEKKSFQCWLISSMNKGSTPFHNKLHAWFWIVWNLVGSHHPMQSKVYQFTSNCCLPHFHSDMAIRKMLATLDDPFTRFLEPEKFRSLRVRFYIILRFPLAYFPRTNILLKAVWNSRCSNWSGVINRLPYKSWHAIWWTYCHFSFSGRSCI